VRFTSIFPACYPGRWPHVHFEVYAARADITDATKAIATSQVALPDNAHGVPPERHKRCSSYGKCS
jgi:protocatechuate 3,4-dioxygenase beta subunit